MYRFVPSFRQDEGLFLIISFISTYTVACKSFSIILLKMHKQTHRNKHKPIFEACVLISTFSPISSLVFFSISQEGTLVVGGPGSFYWQGKHTSPHYFVFSIIPSFYRVSLSEIGRHKSLISQTHSLTGPQESQFPSNKLTRLTLPPPSEQNNRHSER